MLAAAILCVFPRLAGADSVESELWNRIKDGNDVLLLETYLTAFPNGEHAATARELLASLKRKSGTTAESVKRSYLPGETGWIGVNLRAIEAAGFGSGLGGFAIGSLIEKVVEGGPAAKAGLRSGDVVVAIDGKETGKPRELSEVLRAMLPGTPIKVRVVRADGTADLDLTVGGGFTDVSDLAEAGDPGAQWQLALAYSAGTNTGKDPSKAFEWARRSAAQGHADAQNFVGYCYDKGEGVPADAREAAAWFRKAAAKDHAGAINYLGTYYELGRGGLPKDEGEAVAHYRRAAAAGNDFAIRNLERLNLEPYDLARIQSGLAALGHDPGPIDGKMGSKTADAIRAFQAGALVPIDGLPSLALARMLEKAGAPAAGGAAPPGGAAEGAVASRAAVGDFDFSDLDSFDSFD
jgi:hypothetical protein